MRVLEAPPHTITIANGHKMITGLGVWDHPGACKGTNSCSISFVETRGLQSHVSGGVDEELQSINIFIRFHASLSKERELIEPMGIQQDN